MAYSFARLLIIQNLEPLRRNWGKARPQGGQTVRGIPQVLNKPAPFFDRAGSTHGIRGRLQRVPVAALAVDTHGLWQSELPGLAWKQTISRTGHTSILSHKLVADQKAHLQLPDR